MLARQKKPGHGSKGLISKAPYWRLGDSSKAGAITGAPSARQRRRDKPKDRSHLERGERVMIHAETQPVGSVSSFTVLVSEMTGRSVWHRREHRATRCEDRRRRCVLWESVEWRKGPESAARSNAVQRETQSDECSRWLLVEVRSPLLFVQLVQCSLVKGVVILQHLTSTVSWEQPAPLI